MESSWWWLRLIVAAAAILSRWPQAHSDPQDNMLVRGCSQYNATNIADFFRNLNGTFSDLRTQLSGGGAQGRRFATTQRPVYAMVQCRNYMSRADCLACYNSAVSRIRNCSAANGARVILDGCFLRYESNNFYNQTTQQGNDQYCENRNASHATAFSAEGSTMLRDLQVATPRIKGYFAAVKRQVSNSSTIYGIAQCVETISQSGCRDCLDVAYANIHGCLPNGNGRAVDVGCFLRYSDRRFFADNQTINITPFLKEKRGNSSKKKAIIGGVAGGAGLILVLIALFLWYKFSRKSKSTRRGNILGATELQGPNIYSYKDLKDATKNFNEENKLGEGGFGDVYKANLKNGNIIAVKRLDISSGTAKANFETEVRLISNVHHRNIVRLLGCCTKGSELLLVYEYMENGSLDRFLYGEKRGTLTWKQRFDIIFGTARGLAYLHEQYHVCIIHRDIKPGNILLDNDFQAKIADFGLVRLLPENQSHVSTKFAGTLGYTAPEYAIHGHLSEKVDTYSFGVVILEIISGRRCSDMKVDSDTEFLLAEAWKLYDSGMHQKLADETLDENDYTPEELKKMVQIALICTQSPPSSRPTMSEILMMLLNDRSLDQMRVPNMPSFSYGTNRAAGDQVNSTSTRSSLSNATASVSHFTGR